MPSQQRCQGELLKHIFFVTLIPDIIQNPNSSKMLDWKRSIFIPIPKKGNAKEYSNYCTIALIAHASKAMLKILQASLQQCVNHELTDVQAGFIKSTGTRNQISNICWIIEKAREFQKNICFIDYVKAFDCMAHNKLWKILQDISGDCTELLHLWLQRI